MKTLTQRYSQQFVRGALEPMGPWRPFPRCDERPAWDAACEQPINARRRDYLIGRAEVLATRPIPYLLATNYMKFTRIGDRKEYEAPFFERRNTLGTLILAECLSGQGRFVDPIIDMAWAICEEASWCIPAHVHRDDRGALPTQSHHTVDLFAAETGMVIAEAMYLMAPVLKKEAAALVDRMRNQVIERIIVPFETQEYGWYDGHNNWTPWCASNIIGAALYTIDDPDRLARVIFKGMEICDNFIDKYSDDGACDEGPSYWGVAPGALLIFLEHLYDRTGGKINIYDSPKLANMVHYIVDAFMGQGRGLNFADSPARLNVRTQLVSRFGQRVGNDAAQELVGLAMRGNIENGPVVNFIVPEHCGAGLNVRLRDLFWNNGTPRPGRLRCRTTAWFDKTQVLIARQDPNPEVGLTFAIKAGHNKENHNHNDVGHFVVYADGYPGIVDAGVESYSRKTFSSERYTIWCIRGSGHNAAVVGGVEQHNGREFEATDVSLIEDKPGTTGLSMRLEKAYPPGAGLALYMRVAKLDREASIVTVEDRIVFREKPAALSWTYFTAEKPTLLADGTIRIPTGPRALLMRLPECITDVQIEKFPLHDVWMKSGWGEELHTIRLSFTATRLDNLFGFEIRRG